MKAKHVNTYHTIAIVEEICQLAQNICYVDILTKAYITKEFTDIDLNQYIDENGQVDILEIYDLAETMWEQIVHIVGKNKVDFVSNLVQKRYQEINSFDNKIVESLNAMLDYVSRFQNSEAIKNEGDNK